MTRWFISWLTISREIFTRKTLKRYDGLFKNLSPVASCRDGIQDDKTNPRSWACLQSIRHAAHHASNFFWEAGTATTLCGAMSPEYWWAPVSIRKTTCAIWRASRWKFGFSDTSCRIPSCYLPNQSFTSLPVVKKVRCWDLRRSCGVLWLRRHQQLRSFRQSFLSTRIELMLPQSWWQQPSSSKRSSIA